MNQNSQSPKHLSGLLTRVEEKMEKDNAELMVLTSNALAKLDLHLQTQSLDVLHSTSKHLVATSQMLAANVSTSLETISIATNASTEATSKMIERSREYLQGTLVQQTKTLAKAMRETVVIPTTQLQATVEQAGVMLRMAKWILLGTLAACLTACFGTWAFWKWTAPWSSVEFSNGQVYQVLQPGWTTCPVEGKPTPCRLAK